MKRRKKILVTLAVIINVSLGLWLLSILTTRVPLDGLYRSGFAGYLDSDSTGYLYFSDGKLYAFSLHPQRKMTVEQWQYSTGDSYSYGLTTKLFKNRIFVVRSYSWGIYIEDVDGSSEYSFKSLHVPEEIRDYLKLLQK